MKSILMMMINVADGWVGGAGYRLGVLREYQGEDIEIQLPGDMTMRDIDWISVWCISYRENFGHVMIPKDLDLPPALGQNQLTVRHSISLHSPSIH